MVNFVFRLGFLVEMRFLVVVVVVKKDLFLVFRVGIEIGILRICRD